MDCNQEGSVDSSMGEGEGKASGSLKKVPAYREALLRKDATRFKEYIENTTTHGVARIFRGRSWIRRSVWLLVVISVISGLLFFIIERGGRLNAAQKSTSVDIIQARYLSFPAVTICNSNQIKDSFLTSRNLTRYFSCLERLVNGENVSCESFIPPDMRNVSITDLFVEGGQSVQEFISFCAFNGFDCTSLSLTFVPRIIQFHLCYTINDNGSLRAMNTRQFLHIRLNLNNSAYSDITEYGASIIIHPPGQLPSFESAFFIPAGFEGYLGLKFSNRSLLEPRYGSCSRSISLKYYPTYSAAACRNELSIDQILDICGCVPPGAPPRAITNFPVCTVNSTLCAVIFSDISGLDLNSRCPPECVAGEYTAQLSYTLSSTFRAPSAGQNVTAGSFSDTVAVTIQFSSFSVTQISESIAYGPGDFVSDIGGQMGLFIGASIVSVCELLMWIIDELKDRVFQFWRGCKCCTPSERPELPGETDIDGDHTSNSTSDIKAYRLHTTT